MDRFMTQITDPSAQGERSPISILVVDNDVLYLQYFERVFERPHIRIQTATNGATALQRAHEEFDVILMDVLMPDMNGLVCFEKLRQQGCSSAVIIVTGSRSLQVAVDAMKLGVADFVTKPFEVEKLIAKIEAVAYADEEEDDGSSERRKSRERRGRDRRAGDRRTSGVGDRRMGDRRAGDRRVGIERRTRHDDPVITYIRQNAPSIGSRRDVASAMGLEVDQVSARVQMSTGQSFRQLLNECRLKTARRLLTETDIEIALVAEKTGFATVQHFSRVFSTLNGISPRKYRQESRRGNVAV
jgi:YesN/AraC family two-component response regulator